METMSGNKKILISVGAFVIVLLLLVAGLAILKKNGGDEKPPETTTRAEIPIVQEEKTHSEYETNTQPVTNTQPATTVPVTNEQTTAVPVTEVQMSDAEARQINAFISGEYYISSTMIADGTSNDIDIAIRGSDFYTTVDMDGMKMGIMFLNDNIYIINKDQKKYIDFNSIAMMTGNQLDFDMDELKEVAAVFDLSVYNFKEFDQAYVDLDGQTANRYRYYSDEISIYFYFVDDVLKKVEHANADGAIATTFVVKEFSPTIPSGMMSLIGLKKSTIFTFFGEDFLLQ